MSPVQDPCRPADRSLNGDLAAAGIPKREERGRTLDVHALRTTFGTLLSKGGVARRVAQSATRHSSIDLTMNVYTGPKVLDVAGALDVLPSLPLAGDAAGSHRTTGTHNAATSLAPMLGPTSDESGASVAAAGRDRRQMLLLRELGKAAWSLMSTAVGTCRHAGRDWALQDSNL